jgi:endonuclease/exonuclease/phosphatase family metal-dependent hydrolase
MKYDILKSEFGRKACRRIVVNLLNLKEGLERAVPSKANNSDLLLATWNLREFDSNRSGHGHRLTESLLYIGEILSAFDLIVLQELDENLSPLERLLFIMGGNWDYVPTGVCDGERMAFVYDSSRLSFERLSGAMTLPAEISDNLRFVRHPFTATFRMAEISFNICPVHLECTQAEENYAAVNGKKIDTLVKCIAEKTCGENEYGILVGDFNLQTPSNQLMNILMDNGFTVPEPFRGPLCEANKLKTAHHDQIAFIERERELEYAGNENSAGVFDFFQYVYREGDYYPYAKLLDHGKVGTNVRGEVTEKEIEGYFSDVWRTWQMSDHLPLWVELKIDFSMEYLFDLIS